MKNLIQAAVVTLFATSNVSAESITNLGVLPGASTSFANGVSGDGSVVVGTSGNWAFRWTLSAGMQRLPSYGDALGYGVSADGTTAVGYGEAPNYTWNGYRWSTSSGLATFGNVGRTTVATATSSDGGVTVGQYNAGGGAWRGFRFTSSGGFQDLGYSPSYYYSAAFGVSGDGSVIVGGYTDNENVTQAYRLSSGTWQGLGRLAGGSTSTAYGVTNDGSVVVGVSDSQIGQRAFRWTATAGMQSLGTIPGLYNSSATAVSADGNIVVGTCDNGAFVWHASVGMLSLREYLSSRGVDLTGWAVLSKANSISANGRYIVGDGTFEGDRRGFIVDIGVIPTDCNSDNIVDYGQCHDGTLPDYNGNNIPDCCERGEACVVGNYPVQWRVEDGGNGHWYQVRAKVGDWFACRAAAQGLMGDLASPSTAIENSFVERLVPPKQFPIWNRVFLGGRQNNGSAPNEGWYWVDGSAWNYVDWFENQPNGGEGFLVTMPDESGCTWGDYPANSSDIYYFMVEWSADCNNDNIVDYGQILTGQLADLNSNGIPDVCEQPTCHDVDLYNNGRIDGADLAALLSEWGPSTPITRSDFNHDGVVNGSDLSKILGFWGPCQ